MVAVRRCGATGGGFVYARFLNSDNPNDEASAAIVCSAFCLAAYVLARSGEKLSRLALARARRKY